MFIIVILKQIATCSLDILTNHLTILVKQLQRQEQDLLSMPPSLQV